MFEFEDVSTGFHDVFLNKYADSSGPILDFYISDSMQDMLDIDIRTEVATVVGGANEFSLVNDLPSLELDLNSNDADTSWVGGPKWSAPNDIYADVGACVNPNSVMPLITSSLLTSPKCQLDLNTNNFHASTSPLPSPKEKKSHLTFSPNQIKVSSIQEPKRPLTLSTTSSSTTTKTASPILTSSRNPMIDSVKKDLGTELIEDKSIKTPSVISSNNILTSSGNAIKLGAGIGGLTFANSIPYQKLKPLTAAQKTTINGSLGVQIKKERDASPLRIATQNQANLNQQHTTNSTSIVNGSIYTTVSNSFNNSSATNGVKVNQRNNVQVKNNINGISGQNQTNASAKNPKIVNGSDFPKPAYSYSCLIAMALKNSRSGSLPVSEIYSFMCEHFPYFKTAPNGWKNSVRHNLSLNKSFEKIEKPATNGGQRKGCLWAMNPSKILKMDEEVQKWSRKDPMAIRNAMVHPENLEALERGEMKHGSTGDSDGENDLPSDVEENSDSEPDNEIDDHLLETPESLEDDDEEQDKDFDIEITSFYDSIDLNDSKEHLRLQTICPNELMLTDGEIKTPKRARLDINCSISPADIFEHHQIQQHSQQPIQHQSRRKMQLVNRIV